MAQFKESFPVGEVVMFFPRINAALEDHQEEYQPTLVEFEDNVFDQTMSILVDLGASLSYLRS